MTRAWLVALADAPRGRNRIARDVAARASADGTVHRLGALLVTRYDLAVPARALAYLPDRLPTAQVVAGEAQCALDGPAAIRCPGEGAPRVAREVRDVAGALRRHVDQAALDRILAVLPDGAAPFWAA